MRLKAWLRVGLTLGLRARLRDWLKVGLVSIYRYFYIYKLDNDSFQL